MTIIYFVRHAEPNYDNHDDMTRELSLKGLQDRLLVGKLLKGIAVDAIFSSPYQRSVDTVVPIALERGLPIETVEDFRERKVDNGWIEDFTSFCKKQWSDFDYRLSDGESLGQVQKRNIAALHTVLDSYAGKTIVIGTHGTALSTIINHYDPAFGYEQFEAIRKRMPWVVKFTFEKKRLNNIEYIDL